VAMQLTSEYSQEMRDKTGYLAAWVPTTELTVGMIVRVKDGVLERVGDFDAIARHETRVLQNTAAASRITVQSGFTLSAGIEAMSPVGTASASLSHERAFIFVGEGGRTEELDGLDGAGESVLSLFDSGEWRREWLLVTSIMIVNSFSLAICRGGSASLSMEMEPGASVGIPGLRAGGQVSALSGDAVTYVTGSRATPLYRAYGIELRRFRRRSRFGLRRGNEPAGDAGSPFFKEAGLADAGLL
jgi:hypothetical protein